MLLTPATDILASIPYPQRRFARAGRKSGTLLIVIASIAGDGLPFQAPSQSIPSSEDRAMPPSDSMCQMSTCCILCNCRTHSALLSSRTPDSLCAPGLASFAPAIPRSRPTAWPSRHGCIRGLEQAISICSLTLLSPAPIWFSYQLPYRSTRWYRYSSAPVGAPSSEL